MTKDRLYSFEAEDISNPLTISYTYNVNVSRLLVLIKCQLQLSDRDPIEQ